MDVRIVMDVNNAACITCIAFPPPIYIYIYLYLYTNNPPKPFWLLMLVARSTVWRLYPECFGALIHTNRGPDALKEL